MSNSNNIPLDICREILLRLPTQSVFRFRAVCKKWRTIIYEPCFVKAHSNNQLTSSTILIRNSTGPPFHPLCYFDLEALNFTHGLQTVSVCPLDFPELPRVPDLQVAACNGLFLIAPAYIVRNWEDMANWEAQGTWEIWNPLTRERLILPQPTNFINSQVLGYGLGYDCAADDYKVVVIDYEYDKSLRQTHVYSLRSDSWRMVGNCPFDYRWCLEDEYRCGLAKKGVFLNGSLHWVFDDGGGIILFDVGTGSYSQLALPDFERRPKYMILDTLSERLFLSYSKKEGVNSWFHLWVMNDYGEKDSWIKLCSLNRPLSLRPVAYMKNKRRVILTRSSGFVSFDVDSETFITLDIHGISKNISAQVCVGSLFRLHDSCGRRVVAPKKRTRKMKMADTKLTFCVRDINKYDCRSHDSCYSIGSNRYICSSNLEGDKVVLAPSLNPDDESIPLYICRKIFLRLPSKSLIRFRAICKAWRAIIDEPSFVRAHTKKQLASTIILRNSTGPPFSPFYSFDLNDLNFAYGLQKIATSPINFTPTGLSLVQDLPVPACNGLVLLVDNNTKNHLEIWNPFTHERLELPQPKFYNSKSERVTIGIGYDHITDDYKVVEIHCKEKGKRKRKVYQTHVYSLKWDSWKTIGNFPCDDDWKGLRGHCVFACGALHWLLSNSPQTDKIVALDLGTEKYRQLQVPPTPDGYWKEVTLYLDMLDGCLIATFFCQDYDDINGSHETWVMKDYGVGDSWIKLFSTKNYFGDGGLRPVAYMKNKKQIFMNDGDDKFYLLDVDSGSGKDVHIHGLTGSLSAQFVPRSIFRLHDNCGVRGRRGRRTREVEIPEDTELYFCVRDDKEYFKTGDHDLCYILDSNRDYLSTEDED